MTPLELVVFDMAGTTVRDDGQVPDAFSAALRNHGIEPTAEQVRNVRGSSKREALRSFVPDAADGSSRLDDVYASFRRELAERYSDCEVSWLDGVSLDCADWHFNVRPSNTEPLLRLNLEAFTKEEMEARTEEVLGIIRA